jgi:hypothetical protein
MASEVVELAYRGEWDALLRLLERQPESVNTPSAKGYTPLHQAAWHGASRPVVGALLSLGADPSVRSINRNQCAADIALEKHPAREDLQFLLHGKGRTPGQLLRKLVADRPELFKPYDGNRILCDRVLACLYNSNAQGEEVDVGQALLSALRVVAGPAFFASDSVAIDVTPFAMEATPSLWLDTIVPAVVQLSSKARVTPLDLSSAVMADLFDPMPSQWGFRGDPYLWMEMRQALCHVPIPRDDATVGRMLLGCFTALTGAEPSRAENLSVERFSRGGMSSGMICGETWADRLLPQLRQRAEWLRDAWSRVSNGDIDGWAGTSKVD